MCVSLSRALNDGKSAADLDFIAKVAIATAEEEKMNQMGGKKIRKGRRTRFGLQLIASCMLVHPPPSLSLCSLFANLCVYISAKIEILNLCAQCTAVCVRVSACVWKMTIAKMEFILF